MIKKKKTNYFSRSIVDVIFSRLSSVYLLPLSYFPPSLFRKKEWKPTLNCVTVFLSADNANVLYSHDVILVEKIILAKDSFCFFP